MPGVEGRLVLGRTESPVCWRDGSPNILLPFLRLPRKAGVWSFSSRF